MSETARSTSAADLLVHGTFALRRALDRLAHPIRDQLPASRPELPEARKEGRRRAASGPPARCAG